MAVVTEWPEPLGALLETSRKRQWIGGEWMDAASGETLPSIDPSSGVQIAEIPAGDAADVDRAVIAARAAFEGPWASFTPS